MNWRQMISLFVLLFLQIPSCISQNTLSLGAKFGAGAAVIPPRPKFKSNNKVPPVQTNPTAVHGLTVQYMIGKLAGVETGFHLMYHSYTLKDGQTYFHNWFSDGAIIEIVDYQIPILLIYNIEHPFNVKRHYKIVAGTTVDWLGSDLVQSGPLSSLHNSVVGIRIVNDRQTNRIEYSLEHQYSFRRFDLFGVNDQRKEQINTRTSVLTFSLSYFFAVREFR